MEHYKKSSKTKKELSKIIFHSQKSDICDVNGEYILLSKICNHCSNRIKKCENRKKSSSIPKM